MPATSTQTGRATPDGTAAAAREGGMGEAFYHETRGLTLSTIGLGTYLGDTDDAARQAYRAAVERALQCGVTVVDTASNYRSQASERDVGEALASAGNRQRVFVSTKGGFLHGDVAHPEGAQAFIQETYIDRGILEPTDVVGGQHAMTPGFLATELDRSLENLGLETVDLYMVHNPETQLSNGITPQALHERLQAVFEQLERERQAGKLEAYGVATWDGLRVPPGNEQHLGLEQLLEIAEHAHETVGGEGEHGFGGIQLPFSLAMPHAAVTPSQPWRGETVPPLEAARRAGLLVLTSAPLMQGRLLGSVPGQVGKALGTDSDLVAALEFARSAPGPTTALVGMGRPEHVDENLDALEDRKPRPGAVTELLEAAGEGGD